MSGGLIPSRSIWLGAVPLLNILFRSKILVLNSIWEFLREADAMGRWVMGELMGAMDDIDTSCGYSATIAPAHQKLKCSR